MKDIQLQIQDAQYTPSKTNTKKISPRHTVIKLPKIKDKEKNLKVTREKDVLHIEGKVKVVSHSVRPHGLHSPWNSPGQNTGVDSHSLLQGIFPTQGLNPGLPHCRWILYQLSHKGTPYRGKNNSNDPDFSSEIMDTDIQKGANIQNIQKKFVQLNRKRPCNPILK